MNAADFTLGYLTLDAGPAETVLAAQKAGFASCGVRLAPRSVEGRDVREDLAEARLKDLLSRVSNSGVRLSNVTCYQLNPHLTRDTMQRVADAVALVNAPVLVVNAFGLEESAARELYATYCGFAAERGFRLAFEFIPYSAVPDLSSALACIGDADAPSASLVIDLLHLMRSGGALADLGRIDPARIALFQFCDGPATPPAGGLDALRDEARTGRLRAGDGDFDIIGFLRAGCGCADLEYEVPLACRHRLSPLEKAFRAKADLERFIASGAAKDDRERTT